MLVITASHGECPLLTTAVLPTKGVARHDLCNPTKIEKKYVKYTSDLEPIIRPAKEVP